MTLEKQIERIYEKTEIEFEEENYDLDAFEQMVMNYGDASQIPDTLKTQTPLAEFEKNIHQVMKKSGFEYKLELVAVPATCDGSCYEPYYHLCWYDNGIHTRVFHFETCY